MQLTSASKVYCRLASVCIAFLFNQSAFYGETALQSSLNGAIGTYALSAYYIAFMTTSLFLPTLVLKFMKRNYALSACILPFPVYTIANFFPRLYTLTPALILVGCGGTVLWSGSITYISNLADEYAKATGKVKEKTTVLFFGIFYGFISLALLAGNFVSSAVMRAFRDKSKTLSSEVPSISHCGIYNCAANRSDEVDRYSIETQTTQEALHLLFGAFIAVQLVAAGVLFFGVTDDALLSDNHDETTHLAEEMENDAKESKNDRTQSTFRELMKQAMATARLHIVNLSPKLLIPFAMHCGLLQGFALSQFTRDWITCNIGIDYVGYAIGFYGLGSMAGGYGTAIVSKVLPRWVIVLINLLIEIAAWITLLLRELKKGEEDAWLQFLIIGLLGLVHTTRKNVISTVYSLYFSSEKEAAMPSVGIWDSMGKAIAFIISTHICNWTYIIILIFVNCVGTAFYLITEVIYSRNTRET